MLGLCAALASCLTTCQPRALGVQLLKPGACPPPSVSVDIPSG